MKKRLIIITICVVCIGTILGVTLARGARPEVAPDTVAVARGDIVKTILVDGNLEMPDKAYLSFGITGTVTEILVEEGSNVTAGDVLARLDAPSLEISIEMAELQVEMAEEQVGIARAQYDKAREGWQAPEGLEFLEDVIGSLTGLLGMDEDTARANLDAAEMNLEIAELNLESAEINLEKAEIVAPFDGTVADISISEGKEISATALATPAISLVDTGEIQMRGFVDEIDIATIKVGQSANVTMDALPDEQVDGEVAFISPIGTALVGVVSYDTTIALKNPTAQLRDGMTATAEVIIERRDNVLFVPNRALRGTWANPYVLVFIDGQQVEREVTLGLTDGINTEVLSGLEEGEEVVLPASGERPSFFFTGT